MPGCLYEAVISKSAGGIGVAISNVRATGSYVRGTNGKSNGLIPMLRWVFLAGWGIYFVLKLQHVREWMGFVVVFF